MSAQKTAETIHRTGNLREVVPAEKEAAFIAADPLAGDMHVFEGPANDAREATIVQRLLEGGPLSVIVLGATHDLSDEVRAVGNCEYQRVFVAGFPE